MYISLLEKQPINYAGSANGIDLQPVSEEGNTPVNTGGGISAYISDTRWKTMSHMYYWAQAFRKLYPNELEVYYETDDFVCYKLHQNVECLYNLAIDYGYNNPHGNRRKNNGITQKLCCYYSCNAGTIFCFSF